MSAFLLLGTIVSGVGAAGLVMLLYRLFGRRAPRWLLPAVAGVVMLAMHVSLERTWFDRIVAQLSGRIEVVETFERRIWWQPWTLIWPQTARFVALDTASVERFAEDLAQAEVWLVDRRQGSVRVVQVFDCATPRRADRFDAPPDPAPVVPDAGAWVRLAPDDRLWQAVCRRAGG